MSGGLALALVRALAEHGAETGFVRTPAGAVRFARLGAAGAPELLLVHGLGDSLAGWFRVLPRLARRFRVHAIDLPGHGLSERPPDFRLPTVLSALRACAAGLRNPLYVGHSLGGWLCVRLALQLEAGPQSPRGLVLINPGGAALPRAAWADFLSLMNATDAAGARAYLSRAFHRAPLPLRLLPGAILGAMSAAASRGILGALADEDFLAEGELRAIQVPVRLIWGEADRLLPEHSLAFFRQGLPRAELVLLPRAGHMPHLEAPRALSTAIARDLPPR